MQAAKSRLAFVFSKHPQERSTSCEACSARERNAQITRWLNTALIECVAYDAGSQRNECTVNFLSPRGDKRRKFWIKLPTYPCSVTIPSRRRQTDHVAHAFRVASAASTIRQQYPRSRAARTSARSRQIEHEQRLATLGREPSEARSSRERNAQAARWISTACIECVAHDAGSQRNVP